MKLKFISFLIFGFIFYLLFSIVAYIAKEDNSTINDVVKKKSILENKLNLSLPLVPINQSNVKGYVVQGSCNKNIGFVEVTVLGSDLKKNIECIKLGDSGEFKTSFDLSSIESKNVIFKLRQKKITYELSLSDAPTIDKTPIVESPKAIMPLGLIGAVSNYELKVFCSEIGETIEVSGKGIDPSPQYTVCNKKGINIFTLNIDLNVETDFENHLILKSKDNSGNKSLNEEKIKFIVDSIPPKKVEILPLDIKRKQVKKITGFGEVGSAVEVSTGRSGCSVQVNQEGRWGCELYPSVNILLAENIKVIQRDKAGNKSLPVYVKLVQK